MVRHRGDGSRRGARSIRLFAAIGAFVWVVSTLSYGTVGAAAGVEQTAAKAAAAPAAPALPPLCPGCSDFVLDLPAEPSNEDFGTQENTTVDVQVTFPSGWSGLACADKYNVIARRAIVDVDDQQDVPVPGWRCSVPSLNTLRFTGPGIAELDDSAQRFMFRGRSPSQIVDKNSPFSGALTAGFVEITQTFRDGEQQRRRGIKQMQARRDMSTKRGVPVALTATEIALYTTWVDLPPDWIGECATLNNEPDGTPKVGNISRIRAANWDCGPIPGTGSNPRYRVQWAPESTADSGRYFDFNAYTKLDQPTLVPFTGTGLPQGVDRVRDLMFVNGEIRTALVAYLKPGTVTPSPTPSSSTGAGTTTAATASPLPTVTPSYQPLCPTPTPGFNTVAPGTGTIPLTGQLGYPYGYAQPGAPGYPEGPFVYPYNPIQPPGKVPFPGFPLAVGPGIDGLAHDPCAPPTVVLDPCAGEVFTKNGSRRYLPEDRELPDGCAYPVGEDGGPVAYYDGQACLPHKPSPEAGYRPDGPPDPEQLEGPGPQQPDRADRSYQRRALRTAVEPTPPVIVVPPGDRGSTARVPGAPDERLLLTSPNPSPAPTIQALIPEAPLPYCEDLDLPHTGAGGFSVLLRLALLTLGLGTALIAGAMYWRRHAPQGLRYRRS